MSRFFFLCWDTFFVSLSLSLSSLGMDGGIVMRLVMWMIHDGVVGL